MHQQTRFVDIKNFDRQKDKYYKHKAEYLMDIKTDKNLITMSYYLEEVSGVPATIYRSFMADFVEKLESKRRFGFIRLIMETGNPDPFSILIRCFNAYINGLHNGKKLFELGHHDRDPRYFLDCELTGYREEYFELLGTDQKDENNLIGLWLGPNALRVDALEVQRNPGVPEIWKRPIARFAITFCESARLVLINEDLVVAFESLKDFEIRGNYAYITWLTRFWGDICKAAENRIENDTVESDPPVQPEGDRRTIQGCKNLKTNSAYARQALKFRTTRFEGASNKRRKRDVFGSVVEGMERIKKKNAIESDKAKKDLARKEPEAKLMSYTVEQLVSVNPYNPDILPDLENYVNEQVSSESYSLDANLCLLRLYQFEPERMSTQIVARILIKALMAMPAPDFSLCLFLIPERVQMDEQFKTLILLSHYLETAKFRQFWDEAAKARHILDLVPGFELAIRNYAIHVLSLTYQKLPPSVLAEAINLEGPSLDKFLEHYITNNSWVVEKGQGKGQLISLPANEFNHPELKRSTADSIPLDHITRIFPVLG